jgi:hypothetical protein
MNFDDSYTLEEVYRLSGSTFPFWVKGWKARHRIMCVQGTDPEDERALVGRLYSMDRSKSWPGRVKIQRDGLRGWLPVDI